VTLVLTVDQVDSRRNPDLLDGAVALLTEDPRIRVLLPPERTAGDEFQFVAADGPSAVHAVLALTRTGRWSVGCGVAPADRPLADSARASSGPAFVAARDAVSRAKSRPTRFALTATDAEGVARGEDAESLVDLLLVLRSRRTDEGWELYDLLERGGTQADAAARLKVTPQAVSLRARSAALKVEAAATEALGRLVDALDRSNGDPAVREV